MSTICFAMSKYYCSCLVLLCCITMTYVYYTKLWEFTFEDVQNITGDKGSNYWSAMFSVLNLTQMSNPGQKYNELLRCQEKRLKNLKLQCIKHGLQSNLSTMSSEEIKRLLLRFIVDDAHKVILKAIPKTGCSSWKYVLIINSAINRNLKSINPHSWKLITTKYNFIALNGLEKRDAIAKLNQYFSIITVRHPLARLESGFRDKVLDYYNITTDIIDLFDRFLDDIIQHHPDHEMNVHYRPVSWHTNPCAIPLNYIAKTETANLDMDYIIKTKLSGIGKAVQQNDKSAQYKRTEKYVDGGTILPLFSGLKEPKKRIQKLMEKYELDMKLFGYSYEIKNGNVIAMCDSYEGNDNVCC